MANNYSFSLMPSVSVSRSRFERKSQHKTSFNLGKIIPVYIDEVLPGDTRSFDLAALVRMSTPIAPIMDNIYLDFFAFFVPNRIVWDHWKEFQGENNESAGIPSTTYTIPYLGDTVSGGTDIENNSNAAYMGLPINIPLLTQRNKISVLPFRGLASIYNRWFRNQNVIAPLAIQKGDTNEVIVGELSTYGYSNFAIKADQLLTASKLPDYFTKSLPYAQKATAVSIPLGTTAPIIARGTVTHSMGGFVRLEAGAVSSGLLGIGGSDGITLTSNDASGVTTSNARSVGYSNLYADLSTATAATINQLRYAFQLQKLFEKDALYGTRYWEILASHFGITAPDASLQDPEYLGGRRMNINIDQVLSTEGYAAGDQTKLGAPGANSVSGFKGSLFTKSFTEHGYVFVLAVARHDQTYSQGINRMWTRQSRFDFYMPVFANLGAQSVLKKEIFANGSSNDDDVFGYQEAWAEYRYKPSISTGLLNPVDSNALDFWTLTNEFASAPTLGKVFMEQNRDNLSRALVTGANGPDFIADFYFKDIAVRPMPVYSIPGLIDHH